MGITIIAAIIGIVVGLGIGTVVGITYRKKVAEAAIGSAELQAKKIIAKTPAGTKTLTPARIAGYQ